MDHLQINAVGMTQQVAALGIEVGRGGTAEEITQLGKFATHLPT